MSHRSSGTATVNSRGAGPEPSRKLASRSRSKTGGIIAEDTMPGTSDSPSLRDKSGSKNCRSRVSNNRHSEPREENGCFAGSSQAIEEESRPCADFLRFPHSFLLRKAVGCNRIPDPPQHDGS
jgi:hypothetical protein